MSPSKLKQYGLPIAIGAGAFIALFLLFSLLTITSSRSLFSTAGDMAEMAMMDSDISYRGGYGYDQAMADFAPDVEEREIAKTANLNTEIERGEFDEANTKLHTIITSTDGFILTENIRESQGAKHGDYSIKIPKDSYQSVIDQLKSLGEIDSFSENARDVTGQVVNNDIELQVEKQRLLRLQNLYTSRASLEDKLRLEQAIFDQERKITYLEESLQKLDQRVVYSTLSLTLYEEQSALANLTFVGFGDLIKTFIASLKALLYFIVAILPWVIIALLLWLVVRKIRRH